MDRELAQRLRSTASPFDGQTLAPKAMVPIEDLARALTELLAIVGRSERWRWLHDRHEADGAPTTSTEVDAQWVADLADPVELFARRGGQPLVSIGVYPQDVHAYLRTNVMSEDEDPDYPGRWGDFDLTGSSELVERAAGRVRALGIEVEITPALKYFTERAAR